MGIKKDDPMRTARAAARWRIGNIVPAPDAFKVNKQLLGNLDESEFVFAFKELQKLIVQIYEDVEKSPYEWGFKDENKDVGAASNNRISDFLYAFFANGTLKDNELTVDTASFKKAVRKHKNIELIVFGLNKFGMFFDGFSENAALFIVSYPDRPQLIEVLYQYTKAQDLEFSPVTAYHYTFPSFSYRWCEEPTEQKYEPIFHVKMDLSSSAVQEIQHWLHEKADEYGYEIKKSKPFDKGCVFYQKGSKALPHVGDRVFDDGNGKSETYTKVIFRNVLQSHPGEISAIAKKVPGVFGKSGFCSCCNGNKTQDETCSMRILYSFDGKDYVNCAYGSFYFKNITLDIFQDIFTLYLVENKIKIL